MILIRNDGRVLEAYRLGDPILRIREVEGGPPVKCPGGMYSDEEARDIVRGLRSTGAYAYENLAKNRTDP